MDPVTLGLLINSIGNVGFNVFGGLADNQNRSEDRQTEALRLAEQRREFDASMDQRKGEKAMEATQLDPLAQQKSRQRSAIAEALLGGYSPVSYNGKGFSGGLMGITPEHLKSASPFFSEDARMAAEQDFTRNVQKGAPGYSGPQGFNPMGGGYQALGYSQRGDKIADQLRRFRI